MSFTLVAQLPPSHSRQKVLELKGFDPSSSRFSLLRVLDPATPNRDINIAESHFKDVLDTRRIGLDRN